MVAAAASLKHTKTTILLSINAAAILIAGVLIASAIWLNGGMDFKVVAERSDEVDGNIPYNDNVDENTVFYYDFGYYDDISTVGEHEIIVHAKDKTGNYANRSYTLVVEEKVFNLND